MGVTSALLAGAFVLTELATAAPTGNSMTVHWIHEKATGRVAVDVSGQALAGDGVPLISKQFCGQYGADNKIDWDGFADMPLSLDLDVDGLGVIYHGPKAHDTTMCAAMYDDDVALLECTLPYSGALAAMAPSTGTSACLANSTSPLAELSPVHKESLAERHLKKREAKDLYQREAKPELSQEEANALEARQVTPSCYFYSCTVEDGNLNPGDTSYQVQISDNLDCSNGDCSVSSGSTRSQSVSFSVTAAVNEWISGGFSVSESYSTSSTRTCSGTAYQTVCIWTGIPHKAYDVDNAQCNTCGGASSRSAARRMKSPHNVDNAYCVRNACRSIGQGYYP